MKNDAIQLSATSFGRFMANNSHLQPVDFPDFAKDDTVLVVDFTKNGTNNNKIGTFYLLLSPELQLIEEVIWSTKPNSTETLIAPASDIQLPNGERAIFSDNQFQLFANTKDLNQILLDINLQQFGLNINDIHLNHQFIEELLETPHSSWTPNNPISISRQEETYANFNNHLDPTSDDDS